MNNIQIIVATHKDISFLEKKNLLPIQVGKIESANQFNMQGDDEGVNISEKNPNYCELTAHFWAWKNLKNVDIIGLCHYRRFFNLATNWHSINAVKEIANLEIVTHQYDNSQMIHSLLDSYDIVLPKPQILAYSNKTFYELCHIKEDLSILNRVILKLYPEYKETIDQYLFLSNTWIAYNMFICRFDLFRKYSEWLFSILFETEKHIRVSPYSYQKRVFGFLGEILLPLFCFHNKLRINYLQTLLITEKPSNQTLPSILLRNLRNEISFNIAEKVLKSKNIDTANSFFSPYFKNDDIII